MDDNSGDSRKEAGNPLTRLQKLAPASLQLDTTDPLAAFGETSNAIPLLSPLILSPEPVPETTEKPQWESGNDERDNGDDGSEASSPSGWHHPAVPMFTEPAALFTCFQSQCFLVDNVQ
ncbi:hypothetical protein CJ030_MR1G004091 [Morella rubra]|uniref:Uncharacterized protein n=1 Tax=Morella rubra TaxID=262757 RepID=A0A6A1WKQ3_9ROSI|nr:hypothetical protein CJ030_MR1G004091 [Morella rubra]